MTHRFEPSTASAIPTGVYDLNLVLVSGSSARRSAVMRAVEQCGAKAAEIPPVANTESLASGRRSAAAVVEVWPVGSEGQKSSELASALRDAGVNVIAHGDGATKWTLARRCKLFLAGCVALLDSHEETFESDLTRQLAQTLRAARERDAEERSVRDAMRATGVVGDSLSMIALFRRLMRVSPLSDLSTLITGETGTGKELLARALYAQDEKRRAGPFVALNCSAINPALAESELFGHRRGAFTGADRDRRGLIRAAHGGVLFLDEVGELPPDVQAKLLRVLQERRVLALGDEQDVAVSVRVVAATNADLAARVEQGTFRADLYHRLNVLSIHIPPLRERRADIPPLIEHFVRKHQPDTGRRTSIHPEFIEALSHLELPGNARQVENLVRWAVVHNEAGPLSLRDLPPDVWQELLVEEGSPADPPPTDSLDLLAANGWSLSRSLDSCERSILERVLQASHGNQSKAARMLGITPRSVYNKVRRHRLA